MPYVRGGYAKPVSDFESPDTIISRAEMAHKSLTPRTRTQFARPLHALERGSTRAIKPLSASGEGFGVR